MPAAAGLPDMQATGYSTLAAANRCSTLRVFASMDYLSWPGQICGAPKFMHGQMGDQA
jgi:hypothetical protein